ncbi:MAG: 2-succinylbenzoate--CoA ligase [Actinomycetota bacterium]
MPRLVALDLPVAQPLLDAIKQAWDDGDAVLPLDQRMLPAARQRMASELGAHCITTNEGVLPLPGSEEVAPLADGDALVIATSGSTGKPKGVVHTHRSLAAHAAMVGERLALNHDHHWWLCLPAAHIGGFGVIARAWAHQARITTAEHVDDRSITAALADGATHTSVVPTMLKRFSFEQWQRVLVGGARSDTVPSNAISTYGLTETGGGVVYDGRPLSDVKVRIRDGRIHLHAPSLARTYRHAPLALVDNWLDTGDIGELIDGQLRVDGRSDDVINSGGNKIWPQVVEQRLREHPLVADAVVRGIEDAEWGAIVCAWVQPVSPTQSPTLDALRGHVKETLAAYCAPRKLIMVNHIPRNALGKIISADLPRP